MLRIGAFQFAFPVIQAALAGYSDAPMRLIARRFGAPYALRDVILDQTVVQRGKRRRRLLAELPPEDHPVGGQLMGAEPGQFAAAAADLVTAGYDVIDINFACPVKKVLGRCRGGFLLSDPPTAIAILRAVREAVPPGVPVTLKLRRGLDETPASEQKFFAILDAALAIGLDAITLHPRTVKQRYVGLSNWAFLARVKRHVGTRTLIGSGDLFTGVDVRRMFEQTGVDGVALARGCIGNPWLFSETRAVLTGLPLPDPPSVEEQGRVIREHRDLLVAAHGPRLGARILRKFGIHYAELHPAAVDVRRMFIAAMSQNSLDEGLTRWYDPTQPWPPGRRKSGAGLRIAAGAS